MTWTKMQEGKYSLNNDVYKKVCIFDTNIVMEIKIMLRICQTYHHT